MAGEVKYYTLTGMDQVYTDYNVADAAKNSMAIKEDNHFPVPFSTKEDAEAFRQGRWDTYLKEGTKRKKNINVLHVIPERHFKVETSRKLCRECNRAEVRELLKLVLQKEWFRPIFTD